MFRFQRIHMDIGWEDLRSVMLQSVAVLQTALRVAWRASQGGRVMETTALHGASYGGHAEAIRALKEVGFTAIDATDKDGGVRMMHSVCGEWCG